MNQRNIVNLSLAIALAVLIAILAYEPSNETPEKIVLLSQFLSSDIHKINIEQINQHDITLAKMNSQWQIISPTNNQANTLRINKFLDLTSAKVHASYSLDNINLTHLNLLTPELMVTLNNTKLFFGTTDALKGTQLLHGLADLFLVL